MPRGSRKSQRVSCAVICLIALLLGACSPAPSGTVSGQPSLGASQPGTPTRGVPGETPHRAAWRKWLTDVQLCMRERGWELAILPESRGPGFTGPNVPPEQRDAIDGDMQECEREAGEQPFTEMTESLARTYYSEVVQRAECLEKHGFDVQDAPSATLWVAQQLAQDPADIPWDPYEDIPDGSWDEATTACPQGGLWGFE